MIDRAHIAHQLRRAAAHVEAKGLDPIRLDDAKAILLAALNEIDTARDYGRPGAAIDDLLGKLDGPFRLPEGYSDLENKHG